MNQRTQEYLRGMKVAAPLAAGCLPLGFILGTQCAQHGMSLPTVFMMTGINFAGGSEFAATALWSAFPPILIIMMTTWLINCRHIVLGASLAMYMPKCKPWQSALLYAVMTDEVWALTMNDIAKKRKALPADTPLTGLVSLPFYLGIASVFWFCWSSIVATGLVLGSSIKSMDGWGFQMAIPAMFLSLIAMMWPGRERALPIVVSGIAAGLASLALPSHWCVLIGAATGLLTAVLTQNANRGDAS